MLHSTFVAPAQGIINAYLNKQQGLTYQGSYLNKSNNLTDSAAGMQNLGITTGALVNVKPAKAPLHFPGKYVNTAGRVIATADIDEGIIGVSEDKPIDNPSDNLFKLNIPFIPEGSRAYLTYDVYGVSAHSSVARSINQRFSTGGYLVKNQKGWSAQKEELDAAWLKQGNNTVLFTIPEGAGYQYKVKNLNIVIEKGSANNLLVVDNEAVTLTKENRVYIKGFVRQAGQNLKVFAGSQAIEVNNGEFEGFITLTEDIKRSKIVAIQATDNTGFLGQELIMLDTMLEADHLFSIEKKQIQANKFFAAKTAGSLEIYGASIAISDSALIQDNQISITRLRPIDVAPMESGVTNVTKGGKAYRFLPDGTTFAKPVNITLAYDTLLLPTGYTARDIKTYFFDTQTKQWKEVKKEGEDVKNHTITSQTTHFTDYINGIIQSPESPEATAFMPTMMSDIKAADPSAEMTLISPPQASQTGDANISYPIKIPSGRNGIQPDLTLTYNSNGNNGWLGLGWDISAPAITIDTRWGVPLHDPVNESEIYSLNGGQLMYPNGYLPHRHQGTAYSTTPQARNTSGAKLFTSRREGSFAKIERLGANPTNYYWKVTGTDGTISWYGGKAEGDINTGNAVIKDEAGRVVHWALYMVEDVFGNTMKYTYTAPVFTATATAYPTLAGSKAFYLDNIQYSGYNDVNYMYSAVFTRNSTVRPDVTVDARLGVRLANPNLLTKIAIKYQSTVVRNYAFLYGAGHFNKTILTSVAEQNGSGVEFYKHTFSYYNDIVNGNNGNLFRAAVPITLPSVNADYALGLGDDDLLKASKINTSQSIETGFSVKPTVGVEVRPGVYSSKINGTLLVGAPFGESTVKTKGKVTLADIDGDGIDDIVYKSSDGLKYYPGLVNLSGTGDYLVNSFATESKSIHNISDYSSSKSYTKTVFGESWDVSFLKFFAGKQRTKTKTETKVYATDANNDGLLDIVVNGIVHFNHIDLTTNEPTFTTASNVTPNMVITGVGPVGEPQPTPEEQEEDSQQQDFNDDYDVVRVWIAPTSGKIQIKNKITNLGPGQALFSIQKQFEGHSCEVFSQVISTVLDNTITLNGVNCDPQQVPLKVNQGEKIYFRFHKNASGSNPKFDADHYIEYLAIDTPYPSPFPNQGVENYSNSFIASKDVSVEIPANGTVNITWNSFQTTFNVDEVRYRIYKKTVDAQGNITENLIYPPESNLSIGVCPQYTPTTISPITSLSNISVAEGTSFRFEVWSDTNVITSGTAYYLAGLIGWWRPKVIYSAASNSGAESFESYGVPKHSIYRTEDYKGNYKLMPAATDPTFPTWSTVAANQAYNVKPNIEITGGYITPNDNASFLFAVKNASGNVIGKREVIIEDGEISLSNTTPIVLCSSCSVNLQAEYKFEYYVQESNIEVFKKYQQAVTYRTAIVGYASSPSNTNKTAAVSVYYDDYKYLGPLLNNWGQFLYNDHYDTDNNTPVGTGGKLISESIVAAPFASISAISSPLLVTGCAAAENYQECMEDELENALNIPEEGTNFESFDTDGLINNIQGLTTDFQFDLPLLAMEPYIPDGNLFNDKWSGFYNSQYSSSIFVRAGSVEEIDSSGGSSSGGSGLNYAPLGETDEPEPLAANATTGMTAITKIHKNSNRSNNIAWGPIGHSTSQSSYSNTITDFADINGDGYPDILTSDALQKTSRTGGLLTSSGNTLSGHVVQKLSDYSGSALSRTFLNPSQKEADGVYDDVVHNGNSVSSSVTETATTSTSLNGSATVSAHTTSGGGVKMAASASASYGAYSARIGIDNNLDGQDKVTAYWMDMNGDGLPDRVSKITSGYIVELNKGQNVFNGANNDIDNPNDNIYGFNQLDGEVTSPVPNGTSGGFTYGGNLIPSGIISGSVTVGYSVNGGDSDVTFADINGDGLVDRIEGNNVKYNTGVGFGSNVALTAVGTSPNLSSDSRSHALAINGNIGAFYGFPVCCYFAPLVWIKGGLTFDAFSNINLGQTKKIFKDLNGDGFVDFMTYSDDGAVNVNYSAIGRTNMLKDVTNPIGGKFTLDYEASAKTYGNPNTKWVMKNVVVADGYNKVNDGADSYVTSFAYENGYYDRRERSFYGFETVKTLHNNSLASIDGPGVYRTNVAKYYNQSYYLNGLLKESYVLKGNDENAVFSKTVNTYAIKQMNGSVIDLTTVVPLTFDTGGTEGRKSAIALLTETNSYIYELGTTPLVTTTQLQYDNLGRVTKYLYLGNPTVTTDNYTTEIDYHTATATMLTRNLIAIPKEIRVKDNSSVLKRRRTTTILNENTGTIGSIAALISGTTVTAITQMTYDVYGNLASVTLPPNDSSPAQSMVYQYVYDAALNKYLVSVSDSYGNTSSSTYDAKYDKLLTETDNAGNIVVRTYDTNGRLLTVKGPKEAASGAAYTIKMQYYPKYANLSGVVSITQANFTPVAVTSHYDVQNPTNDIQTYTFIDGLARVIQVKKDIMLTSESMSVSGKAYYDDFGRAIIQYHPYYEAKLATTNFIVNEYASPNHSSVKYDETDRVVKTTDPDGNIATTEFSVDASTGLHKTKSTVSQTNTANVINEVYTDVNGRTTKTNNVLAGTSGSTDLNTLLTYNSIGELVSYKDAANVTTSYLYDLLGRKTQLTHLDNGITKYTYDKAGNLTKIQTAKLAANTAIPVADRFIKYNYFYNRPTQILYPATGTTANIATVNYTYGTTGNNKNRLVSQTDATGQQLFEYGNMGEIIHNTRTVVGPNIPTRTFDTYFTYDSWNRVRSMQYPDGEIVNYAYDLGGNLFSMIGKIQGQNYSYIKEIKYDHYEQRTSLLYGNGTYTTYTYDEPMRRLQTMTAMANTKMFDNTYTYDRVGNVTSVNNAATYNSLNQLGGSTTNTYTYDNLNRLTSSQGSFTGHSGQTANNNDANASYTLAMTYNTTHGIATKQQSHLKNGQSFAANTYNNIYTYVSGTHKLQKATKSGTTIAENYTYDANGNMLKKTNTSGSTSLSTRNFYWDESNRLRVVADALQMQHYIYDAGGERILKASSGTEAVYENGTMTGGSVSFDTYTTYPSAYVVVKGSGEYSKHYYAGSQRVVSRIGEQTAGYFEKTATTGKQVTPNLDSKEETEFDDDKLRQLQIQDLTQILAEAKLSVPAFKEYQPATNDDEANDDSEISAAQSKKEASGKLNLDGSTAAAPPTDPGTPTLPTLFPYNSIYFFHPDHLGTSSFLSDANGRPYQYFVNLPFGETMAEQHGLSEDYESPYKFNGKELDDETGLYYYGARYYDPKSSIWLSVDPLAESQSNKTPYHYCSNNPINRTDPTGMIDGEYEKDENGKWQKISTKGDEIGVDFYHTNTYDENGNQITYVTDRKGNWNTIKNGRETLSGNQRGNNINWKDITEEWLSGTGPERSIFEGSHSSIKDLQFFYKLGDTFRGFVSSGKSKGGFEINFTPLVDNILAALNNGQLQMMGSFNASFYTLGDQVFTIVQDTKSRTSFYYHLPVSNHSRGLRRVWNLKGYQEIDDSMSTTYQTYIFMRSRK
ncbi:SpvB/TcaC N-terminal domain-containing protein [Flavobacterium subsaxonicum]|nr:SpvB/TcaC N-terminal domain-containing protein [Flavobacterium subsaxonicum]